MTKKPGIVCCITFILVAIGGLNWGLIGAFDFNIVTTLFGVGTIVTKVVYIVMGVAALWMIIKSLACCKKCG